MAKILEDGPIRRMLREKRILKASGIYSTPQELSIGQRLDVVGSTMVVFGRSLQRFRDKITLTAEEQDEVREMVEDADKLLAYTKKEIGL